MGICCSSGESSVSMARASHPSGGGGELDQDPAAAERVRAAGDEARRLKLGRRLRYAARNLTRSSASDASARVWAGETGANGSMLALPPRELHVATACPST
jgi:hypothetical protein